MVAITPPSPLIALLSTNELFLIVKQGPLSVEELLKVSNKATALAFTGAAAFICNPLKIAPPYSAVLLMKIQFVTVILPSLKIAPPFSATLSINVQLVIEAIIILLFTFFAVAALTTTTIGAAVALAGAAGSAGSAGSAGAEGSIDTPGS